MWQGVYLNEEGYPIEVPANEYESSVMISSAQMQLTI